MQLTTLSRHYNKQFRLDSGMTSGMTFFRRRHEMAINEAVKAVHCACSVYGFINFTSWNLYTILFKPQPNINTTQVNLK